VLDAFLGEWSEVRPKDARIEAGAIGVAGPLEGNRITMTNRPWRLDGDHLAARFDIPRLALVNDLAAAAYGLDLLEPADFMALQDCPPAADGPRVVVGVGTGLGVAYCVGTGKPGPGPGLARAWPRSGTDFLVIPGEGGHVGFSPASPPQMALWKKLAKVHPRVEAEHVVCGAALQRDGVELFSANLGNVVGDQALNVLATGGVYLCGGVIARIAASIDRKAFCEAFVAKGVHSTILKRIPVHAVLAERLPVLGAAARARV
jgi:glucokinase